MATALRLASTAVLLLLLAVAVCAQRVTPVPKNRLSIQVKVGKLAYYLGNMNTSGTSDGTGTGESGASFNSPAGCAIDASGNVFIADSNNQVIRRMADGGDTTTTFAGAMGVQDDVQSGTGTNARFKTPMDIAFSSNGVDGYMVDAGTHRVLAINAVTSNIGRFAGDGTPGDVDGTSEGVQLKGPSAITVAWDTGMIYVAERLGNRVRKLTSAADSSVHCGSPTAATGTTTGACGNALFKGPTGIVYNNANSRIYVADTENFRIVQIGGSQMKVTAGKGTQGPQDGAATVSQFSVPSGLVIDRKNGYVFVADKGNNCIRRVDMVTRYTDTVVGTLEGGWESSPSSIKGAIYSPRGLCQVEGATSTRLFITGDHAVWRVTMFHTRTITKIVVPTPAPPPTPAPTPAPPTPAPTNGAASASLAVVAIVAFVTLL